MYIKLPEYTEEAGESLSREDHCVPLCSLGAPIIPVGECHPTKHTGLPSPAGVCHGEMTSLALAEEAEPLSPKGDGPRPRMGAPVKCLRALAER